MDVDKQLGYERVQVELQKAKGALETELSAVGDRMVKLEKIVSEMSDRVSLEIKNAVRKGIERVKLELIARGDGQEGEIKNMHRGLEAKIDRSEAISLLGLKSNVKDMEVSFRSTDILHKQIQHLSVILIEILRHETNKYIKVKESDQIHENKCLTMLHQCLTVAHWINKFNPQNINTNDLTVPQALREFHVLVTKSFEELSDSTLQMPNSLSQTRKLPKKESESVLTELDKFMSKSKNGLTSNFKVNPDKILDLTSTSEKFKKIASKPIPKRQKISLKPRILLENKAINDTSVLSARDDSQQSRTGMRSPIYHLHEDLSFDSRNFAHSTLKSPKHVPKIKSLDRDVTLPNIY